MFPWHPLCLLVFINEMPPNLHIITHKGCALQGEPAHLTSLPKGKNAILITALSKAGVILPLYFSLPSLRDRALITSSSHCTLHSTIPLNTYSTRSKSQSPMATSCKQPSYRVLMLPHYRTPPTGACTSLAQPVCPLPSVLWLSPHTSNLAPPLAQLHNKWNLQLCSAALPATTAPLSSTANLAIVAQYCINTMCSHPSII